MKKAVLLSLLFSFIFVGCSNKEVQIVFKEKLVCVVQQKIERTQPVQIRVHNDDIEVAKAYKYAIDSNIEFYEKQVDRNNKFCEDIKKINESEGK
ncbi:MAG: hypothetical protein KA277_12285 [Fusobacteriaceae bacterium]|nr:hypothetical protein [Fusobacteriaceae bacterium]